ncbi:MAG: hypothetical protein ACLQI7_12675 [Streptosporangiaceae bacterium]
MVGRAVAQCSVTHASGHAMPHERQISAVSMSPSPVSTSSVITSDEPQSGQMGAW